MAAQEFPAEGMELTHILVVGDAARTRDFYRDVLGAELYREYGGTSVVLRLFGTWLLLVTGGGPTADKPEVTFAPPGDPGTVSHAMTIRVADCRAAYETLRGRGAEFLTAPVEYAWEVRCFFRDPDGHLLELSEAKAPPEGPKVGGRAGWRAAGPGRSICSQVDPGTRGPGRHPPRHAP